MCNARARDSHVHFRDLVVRQILAFCAYAVCVICAITHHAVGGDNTTVNLFVIEISTRRFVPLCALAIAPLLPVNTNTNAALYGPHQGARRRRYKRIAMGGCAATAALGTAAVWHWGSAAIKALNRRDQLHHAALAAELTALLCSVLCMHRALRYLWRGGALAPAQRAHAQITLLALLPPCILAATSSVSVYARDLAALSVAMLAIALMACRSTGAAFERGTYGAHDDVI